MQFVTQGLLIPTYVEVSMMCVCVYACVCVCVHVCMCVSVTVCLCMQVISAEEALAFDIVTYIGCAVSLACLILTVLFYLFQG